MEHKVSTETKKAVDEFESADAAFRKRWEQFENDNATVLEQLDRLREARNAALDTATRSVRNEADDVNFKDKQLKVGRFTAQKKKSSFFNADMFLARLQERDLYEKARDAGAIEEKVTVKYENAKKFLNDEKVYADFEDCEDEEDLTTAVTAPKPVGALGAELRKK